MGDTLALFAEGGMPWKECHVMDERLRFVARVLEGEKMTALCAPLEGSRESAVYGDPHASAVFFDSGRSRQRSGASYRGRPGAISGTAIGSRALRSLVQYRYSLAPDEQGLRVRSKAPCGSPESDPAL